MVHETLVGLPSPCRDVGAQSVEFLGTRQEKLPVQFDVVGLLFRHLENVPVTVRFQVLQMLLQAGQSFTLGQLMENHN